MKKKIGEKDFKRATDALDIGEEAKSVAHAVLVSGAKQSDCAKARGVTRSAVSQIVKRVWLSHLAVSLPDGFVEIQSVILPERQAHTVSQWAKATANKIGKEK